MSDIKNINVIISGVVQGVYYRAWTQETATKLGINGWVRNLSNGNVEAVFSANEETLNTMIEKCYQGPDASDVTDVKVTEIKISPNKGFEVRPTADA